MLKSARPDKTRRAVSHPSRERASAFLFPRARASTGSPGEPGCRRRSTKEPLMILGLEIGMLIAGLMALITGKVTLSKSRVIVGAPARVAGGFLLLPVPLAFAIGLTIGYVQATRGRQQWMDQIQGSLPFIELGIALALGAVAILICLIAPPHRDEKRKYRKEVDEEAEEEGPRWRAVPARP